MDIEQAKQQLKRFKSAASAVEAANEHLESLMDDTTEAWEVLDSENWKDHTSADSDILLDRTQQNDAINDLTARIKRVLGWWA